MTAMSMGHFNGKIDNAHAPCHVTGWYGLIRNHIFGISHPYLRLHCIQYLLWGYDDD